MREIMKDVARDSEVDGEGKKTEKINDEARLTFLVDQQKLLLFCHVV